MRGRKASGIPRGRSQPPYNFFVSSSINDLNVKIRVGYLEGSPTRATYEDVLKDALLKYSGQWIENAADLYVECCLYCDGEQVSLPVRTSFRPTSEATCSWGQWLTLPVRYSELAPATQISLTVWNVYGPRKRIPVGGTTFSLFTPEGVMRSGRQKLFLWRDKEADGGTTVTKPVITPDTLADTALAGLGIYPATQFETTTSTNTPGFIASSGEADRLERCVREYNRGAILAVTWLDPLTIRVVEKINSKEVEGSEDMWLYVSLPQFDHPVHCPCEQVPPPSMRRPNRGLVVVPDDDLDRENPVELKHRKLTRSHRRENLNRNLKPNSIERKSITGIIGTPSTHILSPEEKDLLWKFRFSLVREPKGLTKFVKCVDWDDPEEAIDAAQLISQWAPITIDDALELLSAKKEFRNPVVREFAVRKLAETEDDEMMLFLLQLVQALRYEKHPASSQLAMLLTQRAGRNPTLGNFLHWYLTVECEDETFGEKFQEILALFAGVLAEREDGEERMKMLRRQGELVGQMSALGRELKISKDRVKRIGMMRDMLSPGGQYAELGEFPPIQMPHHPSKVIVGIDPAKSTIFKSNLAPLAFLFKLQVDGGYRVMFKVGDDLRQDQLIIQIITLMDLRLRKENLDLRLTPYKVLATSINTGLVELVPNSVNVAEILAENKGAFQEWFRELSPDPNGPYGISADVLDTFVRSCAGYCVITYILGIGDRHLDNLLVTKQGNLFHIDFGFILGRDPKPFPPPMKLCKEMVEAMGGAESKHYKQFVAYCCESFNILRKSANLIINLLSLMIDANIPDLAVEPERCLQRVHDNFRLDLSDEEAIEFFQQQISESVAALFPQIAETIHRWAQYWRK